MPPSSRGSFDCIAVAAVRWFASRGNEGIRTRARAQECVRARASAYWGKHGWPKRKSVRISLSLDALMLTCRHSGRAEKRIARLVQTLEAFWSLDRRICAVSARSDSAQIEKKRDTRKILACSASKQEMHLSRSKKNDADLHPVKLSTDQQWS